MWSKLFLVSSALSVISQASADVVEVHFVPHSHMDAGWLSTYDVYYNTKVHGIFESVFAQL